MRNSMKKITFIVAAVVSSATFAAESTNALFVNNNTIENGSYKTINYKICTNAQSGVSCSSLQSIDIKDASSGSSRVIAKVALKAGEFVEVVSALEKDNTGHEIASGSYLMDYQLSHCEAGLREITVFDNYKTGNTNAESAVTCQEVYR